MSFSNFAGGLASAFNAATQTAENMSDRTRALEERKADREYQANQREYNIGQQKRATEKQGREDAVELELAGLSTTVDEAETPVEAQKPAMSVAPEAGSEKPWSLDDSTEPAPAMSVAPGGGTPKPADPLKTPTRTTRNKTMAELAISRADILMKTPGRFAEGAKLLEYAAQQAGVSANYKINQLELDSKDQSLYEMGQSAVKIFNATGATGGVSGLTENPDGSISMLATSRETGKTMPLSFKDRGDLIAKMRASQTPAVYDRIVQAKVANDLAILKEAAKPYSLAAGATRVIPATPGSPERTISNDNGYYQDGTNADGSPRMVRSGASGSGGKIPFSKMTPHEQSMSLIVDASKDAEGSFKLSPDQSLTAQNLSGDILRMNTGMNPQQAASVAMRVTADPAQRVAAIDMANGYVVSAYMDPQSQEKTTISNFPAQRITPEVKAALKLEIPALLTNLNAETSNLGDLVQRAAFGDKSASQSIYATLLDQNKLMISRQLKAGGVPTPTDAQLTQAATRKVTEDIPLINRQIGLVAAYGDRPKVANEMRGGTRTTTQAGGLNYTPPANSPAGKVAARRQAGRDAATQAQADNTRRNEALAAALQSQANTALAITKPEARMQAAQAIQDNPDFDLLSAASKSIIFRAVNGR